MSIRSFALCSALLITAAPAGAQQFNDWMTPHPGYSVGSGDESAQYGDARRIAYDNGYRKGVERGENAVQRSQGSGLSAREGLSQRRQRIQPELRRQGPLSRTVPQRLCRRLPDGLQPLWLQRRRLGPAGAMEDVSEPSARLPAGAIPSRILGRTGRLRQRTAYGVRVTRSRMA